MEHIFDISDKCVYLYIDESEGKDSNDEQYLYLCVSVVLSEDYSHIEDILTSAKEEFTIDQFNGVATKSIDRLLHYNDDNEDVKLKLVEMMRQMYFKSYVSKNKLANRNYHDVYLFSLNKLLKDRIVKYKDRLIIIRYEQNSKISHDSFCNQINSVLSSICKENKHAIKSELIIEKVTKKDILISLPDYTLGLLMSYMDEKTKVNPLLYKINRFEKIRSKLRLFADLDSRVFYSRKSGLHI